MPTPNRPAATTYRFVALLRGVNVGGNNPIKMSVLRESFAALGFTDVVTYIQSGNVVFSSTAATTRGLTRRIEASLRAHLGESAWVLVVSHDELSAIVEQAPGGFGADPATYRYDVLFTREPLTPADVLAEVTLREGVDEAHAGTRALYFRRLSSRASQSRLPQLVQKPVYKGVTIRNWNTTTKLLAMLRTPCRVTRDHLWARSDDGASRPA